MRCHTETVFDQCPGALGSAGFPFFFSVPWYFAFLFHALSAHPLKLGYCGLYLMEVFCSPHVSTHISARLSATN